MFRSVPVSSLIDYVIIKWKIAKNKEENTAKMYTTRKKDKANDRWKKNRTERNRHEMKWNYSCHVNTLVVYYIIILLSGTHFVFNLKQNKQHKKKKIDKSKKKNKQTNRKHIKNTINIQKLKY